MEELPDFHKELEGRRSCVDIRGRKNSLLDLRSSFLLLVEETLNRREYPTVAPSELQEGWREITGVNRVRAVSSVLPKHASHSWRIF